MFDILCCSQKIHVPIYIPSGFFGLIPAYCHMICIVWSDYFNLFYVRLW